MLPQIGIDPGISAGCISVFDNGKLHIFKMPEKFMEINELLKPFGCGKASIEQINSRPNFSPFANKRMEPLIKNVEHLKNAMEINRIEYKEVAPSTWQKYHGLILPKGIGEKGMDYDELLRLEKELKHLEIHRSIETKVQNDVVYSENIKFILETSGKLAARKALCDSFTYFSKYDINKAIEETEKSIAKFKSQEKVIRKKRYQTYITKKLKSEGYDKKIPLWQSDSLCILLYQINN